MNLGGSSSARTSKRTRTVASLVASIISKPAVAAAWRSSQPSPRTANACARRSAAGSTRRTRAITRRPMPSSPPTSSSAGSISARCWSLSSSARRSSVTYNGLPPLAVQTASDNRSLDPLAHRGAHERADGVFAQQHRTQNRWRFGAQRQQRRTGKRWVTGPKRNQQHYRLDPPAAERGRSTSATRARLPSARHQSPTAAVEQPIDWRSASTARAKQQRTCRRPSFHSSSEQQLPRCGGGPDEQ